MDRISHTPGMDWCLPQSPQPTECTVVVLTHLQRRWPESVKQEVVPEGETQTGRLCSVSPGMREWERNPSGSPIPASVSLLLSLFLFFCSPRPPGPPSGSSTCPHFSPEQPLPPPPGPGRLRGVGQSCQSAWGKPHTLEQGALSSEPTTTPIFPARQK